MYESFDSCRNRFWQLWKCITTVVKIHFHSCQTNTSLKSLNLTTGIKELFHLRDWIYLYTDKKVNIVTIPYPISKKQRKVYEWQMTDCFNENYFNDPSWKMLTEFNKNKPTISWLPRSVLLYLYSNPYRDWPSLYRISRPEVRTVLTNV